MILYSLTALITPFLVNSFPNKETPSVPNNTPRIMTVKELLVF